MGRVKTAAAFVSLLLAYTAGAAGASVESATVPQNSAAAQQFYVEDIKAAMLAYIVAQVDTDGVFHMRDDKTGETLALRFVKIHDPVRQIDGDTYFACTDFHVLGETEKLYDLDFWLNPSTGHLAVYDSKVHKEPRRSLLYGWYKQPRYTFVDDRVVSLY